MKLAQRLNGVEPSMTLKVAARAAELRAKGIDVVSFGAGEPDFDTPAHIKEAAKKALEGGATKYTPVEGTPELRQAAAAWFGRAHGFDVAPDEVMVSAGAKQVIFNAFHAVLDEGDEVILLAPYWVSYSEIAKLAGARPVPVVSRAEDGFVASPEAVARAITRRTRMLLIVSPCNPTGAVYDEKTLRALAALAVEPGRHLRRAGGRLLRLPGSVGVQRPQDARGQGDRRRSRAVRVSHRGGEGGGGAGDLVLRPRLRAPVIRDVASEHREGRRPHGRSALQAPIDALTAPTMRHPLRLGAAE